MWKGKHIKRVRIIMLCVPFLNCRLQFCRSFFKPIPTVSSISLFHLKLYFHIVVGMHMNSRDLPHILPQCSRSVRSRIGPQESWVRTPIETRMYIAFFCGVLTRVSRSLTFSQSPAQKLAYFWTRTDQMKFVCDNWKMSDIFSCQMFLLHSKWKICFFGGYVMMM